MNRVIAEADGCSVQFRIPIGRTSHQRDFNGARQLRMKTANLVLALPLKIEEYAPALAFASISAERRERENTYPHTC